MHAAVLGQAGSGSVEIGPVPPAGPPNMMSPGQLLPTPVPAFEASLEPPEELAEPPLPPWPPLEPTSRFCPAHAERVMSANASFFVVMVSTKFDSHEPDPSRNRADGCAHSVEQRAVGIAFREVLAGHARFREARGTNESLHPQRFSLLLERAVRIALGVRLQGFQRGRVVAYSKCGAS